ncbi:MAG: GntR family transcriptional regulator [Rhodospirillales bacterium]|nr:GntR family transcriptional regulator [Rhodospirillales bacterium]
MRTAPIPHVKLSDKTYELLKEMIVRWELRPGERLIDAEIAEKFGVSRSLVRNALASLANDGLVQVFRRGFYVTDFNQKDVSDLLEFRRLLETSSLKAAIENTSDTEIADMEAKLAEAQALLTAGDIETFFAFDVQTHRMIVDKGQNNYTKKVYDNLSTILRMIIRSDFEKQSKISEAFQEHRAIFEAWKQRDVKGALAALNHHLSGAEKRVMENFVQSLGAVPASSIARPGSRGEPKPAPELRLFGTFASREN